MLERTGHLDSVAKERAVTILACALLFLSYLLVANVFFGIEVGVVHLAVIIAPDIVLLVCFASKFIRDLQKGRLTLFSVLSLLLGFVFLLFALMSCQIRLK
ncbi:MAG: hypothetical protein A3J55_03305 [Candidatus Ryanbacteria bacterium RIFCSPHIGHO2_02_FULL_45_17b]|uniref:Uncharacterized protein n=1 Tax=Candidatus Ryanbacteria bacterium RIFCSPHIGHO2_01_FULL_45_22 TaxID=1802114 RepID=A0A1G2G3A5_9BACT|nr:MAG: hypothetical protein A2719_04505 [Candidatus Ryanbacteria bacterium RIFCSPHIGHO2_01_FULL_45_22]OGZ47489.1 MAG: hypothetical protein A3J55_03305 [Candidatus Ryanbacteria bacterium RIFCSPHIGHO2_02_FULL_45_17b]